MQNETKVTGTEQDIQFGVTENGLGSGKLAILLTAFFAMLVWAARSAGAGSITQTLMTIALAAVVIIVWQMETIKTTIAIYRQEAYTKMLRIWQEPVIANADAKLMLERVFAEIRPEELLPYIGQALGISMAQLEAAMKNGSVLNLARAMALLDLAQLGVGGQNSAAVLRGIFVKALNDGEQVTALEEARSDAAAKLELATQARAASEREEQQVTAAIRQMQERLLIFQQSKQEEAETATQQATVLSGFLANAEAAILPELPLPFWLVFYGISGGEK